MIKEIRAFCDEGGTFDAVAVNRGNCLRSSLTAMRHDFFHLRNHDTGQESVRRLVLGHRTNAGHSPNGDRSPDLGGQ